MNQIMTVTLVRHAQADAAALDPAARIDGAAHV